MSLEADPLGIGRPREVVFDVIVGAFVFSKDEPMPVRGHVVNDEVASFDVGRFFPSVEK